MKDKKILSGLIFIILMVVAMPLFADTANSLISITSANGNNMPHKNSNILVVYYSRTGATKVMAQEIAHKFGADTVSLNADVYRLSSEGFDRATADALKHHAAIIEPAIIDMSKYRLIFLGSPIWWYSPAPPLWTFVEKNNFKGKSVILFNTCNAEFKKSEIDKFQQLVENKGGRFVEHIYIKRGRGNNQISEKELITQVQELLRIREKSWQL